MKLDGTDKHGILSSTNVFVVAERQPLGEDQWRS